MTRMRIAAPMDWQTRLKKQRLDSIGKGGNPPRRQGGRIRPRSRFCVRCWGYCNGRCRIDNARQKPSKRLPVGKRRDKRAPARPR